MLHHSGEIYPPCQSVLRFCHRWITLHWFMHLCSSILVYASWYLVFFFLIFSLTGVQVPCNITWQHVQCLLMWKSWIQTLGWCLATTVLSLVLAMLPVDLLRYTNKLQVWRIAMWSRCNAWNMLTMLVHIFCYFSCVDTVRKEAATITAVFPAPNEVMAILVQVNGNQ